jgi:GNAT superfamily N-acetyltransferase
MSVPASLDESLVVRAYEDRDEHEVLDLLRRSLGEGPAGERSSAFFRWKHLENPFGRSFMIVAESDGRIIGFRSLMRWRFRLGGEERFVESVRPVDTATHPDYRGRGVFSMLTRAALESLRDQVDLVFNTPNPDSLAGYLKMGWQVVGTLRPSIQVCRPSLWRAARRSATSSVSERPKIVAPSAAEALVDEAALAELIGDAEVPRQRYATPIGLDYLRWRYADAPLLDYRAVREDRDGRLDGLAFFRARREGSLWGIVVSQLFVRPGDTGAARRLLARIRRSSEVAYVAGVFPRASAAARARRGPRTLPSPRTITLVVNPLTEGLVPDPRDPSSWGLSTCDVEVF